MNILLEKSLMDCHCFGVDSLVLKDAPQMIRIFVARRDHLLYKNLPWKGSSGTMSVGMHRHHCDVTLMPLLGVVENIELCFNNEEGHPAPMYSYRFRSHLRDRDVGGFEPIDGYGVSLMTRRTLIDKPLFMQASKLHTIYVPYGSIAAWMVWEGTEDPEYSPLVYSNDISLAKFDFSGLDLPMTRERLAEDLALLGMRNYPVPENA